MMFQPIITPTSSSSSSSFSSLFTVILWLLTIIAAVHGEFNYEVEKRVLERIHDFMNGPVTTNSLTSKYRRVGGFPYNMDARDRDKYLTYAYTYMEHYTFDMVYYGLEDGLFLGYGRHWGTYREPANSGYNISDMKPDYEKYFYSCVNRETGAGEKCILTSGSKYIQCINDCKKEPCSDRISQMCYQYQLNTTSNSDNNTKDSVPVECQEPNSIKWCPQYDILETSENNTEPTDLGFIPRFYHCHDEIGRLTQTIGKVVQQSDGVSLGNCYYGDGKTLVNHSMIDKYEYCNGSKCNAFVGAYRSRDYDPRYRTWYTITKELQEPNWSPPYVFFSKLELGITYSVPIYSPHYDDDDNDDDNGSLMKNNEHRRSLFAGVLAVDYKFEDISNFLRTSYLNTSTSIVVYEKNEPNYLVASSTGRKPAKHVLRDDETIPCPDVSSANSEQLCKVIRYEMSALEGHPMDRLFTLAFQSQKERGYPKELVTFQEEQGHANDASTDSKFSTLYVSQSSEYRVGNLEWVILVISPAKESGQSYALTVDDALFGVVCFIGVMGIFLCSLLFVLFYRKRSKRAVFLRDWRFTCAFIMGCALMNISSLTFLGPNTDALCVTRMWSFHLLLVMTVSPLFVKIWRIRVLADCSERIQRRSVTNTKAAFYTMPFIGIQTIILMFFTIFDPPRQKEEINILEGIVTQQVICSQNSPIAFTIVESCFEAGLILIGCVLAFLTRNLNEDFGEARELMFSMYNIAFVGITASIVIFVLDIDTAGRIICITICIFWGTLFSSAAFVLPRLVQVKKDEREDGSSRLSRYSKNSSRASRSSLRISGLESSFSHLLNAPNNTRNSFNTQNASSFNTTNNTSFNSSLNIQRLDTEIRLIEEDPSGERSGVEETSGFDECDDEPVSIIEQ